MQEKITKAIIKKVVPIYGRVFKDNSLNLANIEEISSDNATIEQKTEYYKCGVIAFQLTGIAFMVPSIGLSIISIGIFRSYNIFLAIIISIFCMLLSIGLTFELLKLKNEKSMVNYTPKELVKGIIIGITSTIFFNYLLYVGLTFP